MEVSERKRWITIAILLVVLVLVRYINFGRAGTGDAVADLDEIRQKELIFTRHAECRMDCRTIDEAEVRNALADGKPNWLKSDPLDKPCPTLALEDRTDDGQRVRIIFANCDRVLKVVTAIDLDREYQCSCP